MLVLLGGHALAALVAPAAVRRLDRRAVALLALVPAAACAFLLTRLPAVLAGRVEVETLPWIPALGVSLTLRLDTLSAVLSVLVTGIGALVVLYCARYFGPGAAGLGRVVALLLAFAGAMLVLVGADDAVVAYVGWELTTVLSFLLVGHGGTARAGRAAAMQALSVTAAGGLTLLAGLVALAQAAGTTRLSGIVAAGAAGHLHGPAVTAGTVCVLVGALSKSALVPFHFWLPSAMAAPTPVSAFLHAAAMVKAGVYLVLRLAPGLSAVPGWHPVLAVVGAVTMLFGGVQALRQHDLKLLLAHGTVSQLGLLILLAGTGDRDAGSAALALLVAHALFKAALFLVVGIVDRRAGTRDRRELSGLGRRAPVLAGAGVLAAASMAGLPPLLGFAAKESAFEAFWHHAAGPATPGLLVVVAAGSVLTVAYSARFVGGAFADRPGVRTPGAAPGTLFLVPPVLLAALGVAGGPAVGTLATLFAGYTSRLPAADPTPLELTAWPGLTGASALSALVIALGLGLAVPRVSDRLLGRRPLRAVRAEVSWRVVIHGVERTALRATALTQRGSLPVVLSTVLLVLLAGPGASLVATGALRALRVDRLADSPVEVVAAVVAATAALAAVATTRRVAAVLLVGALGYAVALILAVAGAPDVALTQSLVETMTLVTAVLVIRRLPRDLSTRHTPRVRWARAAVAVPAGALLALLGGTALGARSTAPVSAAFPPLAVAFGAGRNVVNVTLVDIRAWDTLGEISVLLAAATGVASLVFLDRRYGRPPHGRRRRRDRTVTGIPAGSGQPAGEAAGTGWLRGPGVERRRRDDVGLPGLPVDRSPLLEVVTRWVFPTVMVLSLYFLFAGHNGPGGGFTGGLLAGMALVLRYVAGGRYELGEAAPVEAGVLLGAGLLLAGASGLGGLLLGGEVLQTAALSVDLPLLGHVKFVTSLFFDGGVYLIVVGLVLDILRSLGAELDRRLLARARPAADPTRAEGS